MGWRLAEEVAWARPARPGGEWWTLMDIAQDARDETRQSMCGHEYLMARAKCSKATLYRRLEVLRKNGLLKVVRHSAPGTRAIYEVGLMPGTGLAVAETCCPVDNSETGLSIDETCSPVDNAGTGLTDAETRPVFERSNGSQKPFETGLSVSETHAVTTYPVTNTGVEAAQPEVEGAALSTGKTGKPRNGHWRDPAGLALHQAAEARAARIAREGK